MRANEKPDVIVYEDDYLESRPGGLAGGPKEPGKHRGWLRKLAICLMTMAFVAVVAVLVYGVFLLNNVAKISTNPWDFSGLLADNGRTNILVLGSGDPGHAGEKLTDTVMVLSFDKSTKRYAQISIPRDLRVDIPGHGKRKVNTANALGGVGLAQETVSNTLDVPIHYYVQTDFSGLREVVDAVGGLDIDVKEALVDANYPCDDNQYKACGLRIEAGLQHMDGTKVLQYARCRKGTCGNDFGRAARQQEVISLLKDKLLKAETWLRPSSLLAVTEALHKALKTNIGPMQMAYLALQWQQMNKQEPVRLVLHTGKDGFLKSSGDSSDLVPADGTFKAIRERVQTLFSDPPAQSDPLAE
jgi:LCP family protein required for cell wall assembly